MSHGSRLGTGKTTAVIPAVTICRMDQDAENYLEARKNRHQQQQLNILSVEDKVIEEPQVVEKKTSALPRRPFVKPTKVYEPPVEAGGDSVDPPVYTDDNLENIASVRRFHKEMAKKNPPVEKEKPTPTSEPPKRVMRKVGRLPKKEPAMAGATNSTSPVYNNNLDSIASKRRFYKAMAEKNKESHA